MRIGLDHPPRVGLHSLLIARNLLLLETPLGQLDLMTEEITPSHRMAQPKPRPQSPQPLKTLGIMLVTLVDLHEPIVVGVACKASETVSRDLLLKVNFSDGGSNVV